MINKTTDIKSDWEVFEKLPIKIRAIKMKEKFCVKTIEGSMEGKAGDFLIEGIEKELYPCDAKIFEKTYRKVQ
jgi:hypothetical protein